MPTEGELPEGLDEEEILTTLEREQKRVSSTIYRQSEVLRNDIEEPQWEPGLLDISYHDRQIKEEIEPDSMEKMTMYNLKEELLSDGSDVDEDKIE